MMVIYHYIKSCLQVKTITPPPKPTTHQETEVVQSVSLTSRLSALTLHSVI